MRELLGYVRMYAYVFEHYFHGFLFLCRLFFVVSFLEKGPVELIAPSWSVHCRLVDACLSDDGCLSYSIENMPACSRAFLGSWITTDFLLLFSSTSAHRLN